MFGKRPAFTRKSMPDDDNAESVRSVRWSTNMSSMSSMYGPPRDHWRLGQNKSELFRQSHVVLQGRSTIASFEPSLKKSTSGSTSILSLANKAKRMTLCREKETRWKHKEAEFQLCKKMGDKELAEHIRRAPSAGRAADMSGQHLIHWCTITDKPLSVLAIGSSPHNRKELNAKDSRGRTPLHLAVSGENEHMVNILLKLGAHTDMLDNSRMMPVHVAASIGSIAVLQALLDKPIDPNLSGDGGYTALHFAAASDNPRCIETLMENGASLMVRSNNGSYPVHTASKCGSSKALEALILGAAKQSLDEALMLTIKDRDGQLPIHNAVNNGGAESVIVCLKYGSSLLTAKDNGVTPVHSAASQGNLDLLKTMYAFNPEMFKEALKQQDFMLRTPLHWAAIFNHESVVKYLIKMSNVNTFDASNHTPLLSAASNACWETLSALLSHKETNTEVMDMNQRNALHLAIMQGMNLQEMLPVWKTVRNVAKRCNEVDITGSTPLHYAAWNGDIMDVTALLDLGANARVRNKQRQNPFHIACKNGCHDVCLQLLNQSDGSRLKNEQDETGQSPLHLAAAGGYVLIVNVLLQRGAVISKDMAVNTPLHLAAAGGHIPCVHSLLSVHLDLLDGENMDGNTALHLAAANGHAATVDLLLSAGAEITYNTAGKCFYDDALTEGYREVMEVLIHHERWHEILSVFSQYHGQLFLGLIRFLPVCCIMVLDKCVIESSNDRNNVDYSVTYNFRYLQLGEEYASFAKVFRLKHSPLLPIEMMLEHERDDCLRHKLIAVYLKDKWRRYGRLVNFLDICVYCIYMGSLTLFVVLHDPLEHHHMNTTVLRPLNTLRPAVDEKKGGLIFVWSEPVQASFSDWTDFDHKAPWFPGDAQTYHQTLVENLAIVIVCIYSFLHISKEIVGVCTTGWESLKEVNLYLQMATYTTSIYFMGPFLMGFSTHTQWGAAAIAIFLAWFNFLVLCQRFEMVGLYIVMYLEIMKTLFQILFIFLVLMVAFGLAFYILHSGHDLEIHSTPLTSLYRTFILVFELDFILTMIRPYHDGHAKTMHFGWLAFLFLALFLLCMPLLLINLMIGLAVGDIQSVLRCAYQKKLATQVDFHTNIERKLKFLANKTPEKMVIYPNTNEVSLKMWFLKFIGWKTKFDEEGRYTYTNYRERTSPAMLSLFEVHRELDHIKRDLKLIMHRLGLEINDYVKRGPMDDITDPFSTQNGRPWSQRPSVEHSV